MVTHLILFGSYLKPEADRLGNLDVAVRWNVRECWKSAKDVAAFINKMAEGRYRHPPYCYSWPQKQLYDKLRNRQRTISIEDWSRLVELMGQHPNLKYQVVYGDPATIMKEKT